jgi:hypothetical protein
LYCFENATNFASLVSNSSLTCLQAIDLSYYSEVLSSLFLLISTFLQLTFPSGFLTTSPTLLPRAILPRAEGGAFSVSADMADCRVQSRFRTKGERK